MHITLHFTRSREADDPYLFRFRPETYQLHGEGRQVATARLAWDDDLLEDISALHTLDTDPSILQRIGNRLRMFLGEAGWARQEAEIMHAVDEGEVVFLTIVSNAAELYALPWELLTIQATGQRLGELPKVLIRYAWPGTSSEPEGDGRPEGGRILLVTSDSLGMVPEEEHRQAIQRACQAGHFDAFFDHERDVVSGISFERLAAILTQAEEDEEPISVLHILCHGTSRGQDEDEVFGLGWYDERGREAFVAPDRLRGFLSQDFAKQLRLVVLAACDSGNIGAMGSQVGSVAQAVHQAGIPSVVASRFPFSVRGSIAFVEALYHRLLTGPTSLEDAFLAARQRLVKSSDDLDWASVQLYARQEDGDDTRPLIIRPYRGLLPFQAEHARLMFGRDVERRQVLGLLHALAEAGKPRFVVVAGASGTGKSSVVRAGALPDLLRPPDRSGAEDVRAVLRRVQRALERVSRTSKSPLVRDMLQKIHDGAADDEALEGAWEHALIKPGDDPLGVLSSALATRSDKAAPFVLVVDQFEEIFTHTEDAQVREQFARRLWSLSHGDSRVHIIITIRVDFLGHCGDIVVDESGIRLDRIAYDDEHRVFVAQMAPDMMREAIEGPARLLGLEIQHGLTERMLSDVGGEPGALPLLQYTLDRLWEKRRARVLDVEVYQELGGVVGALQKKADSLIDSFTHEQQVAARRLLTRLVEFGMDGADTRRRGDIANLTPENEEQRAAFQHALDDLVEARLLVRGEVRGQATVEVAHEALIRTWERLREWLRQDIDKLSELNKVEAWVVQWQEHGTLLSGAQLGYASEVAANYPDDIDGPMQELIQRSQAKRRSRQRLSNIGIAVGVLVLFAMTSLAVLAYNESIEAGEQREEARKNEEEAEKKRIQAERESLVTRNATRVTVANGSSAAQAISLLREIQTLPPERSADDPDAGVEIGIDDLVDPTVEIVGWWRAFQNIRADWLEVERLRGHDAPLVAVAYSADGNHMVTASADETARVWSREDGGALDSQVLDGHFDALTAVAISRDGQRVVTASDDHTARVWRPTDKIVTADDGTETTEIVWTSDALVGHESGLTSIALAPDGERVLTTASLDATARVWSRTPEGWRAATLEGHQAPLTSAAFGPEGLHVVTASADGQVRVWTRIDNTSWQSEVLEGHEQAVRAALFSPDGETVITGSDDNTLRVWQRSRRGRWRDRDYKSPAGPVTSLTISPDGQRLATTSSGKTVSVWSQRSGRWSSVELEGHTGQILSVAFSADGERIVTTARDETARVWAIGARDSDRGDWNAQVLAGHTDTVVAAAFSPDGRSVLTASRDNTARIWVPNQQSRWDSVALDSGAPVLAAAFAPNDERMVSASRDKVRVWTQGESDADWLTTELDGPSSPISAAFSPKGDTIVATYAGPAALVWTRAEDGNWASTKLPKIAGAINSFEFSADGTRLLIASSDRRARLFAQDGPAGEWQAVELEGHEKPVVSAHMSARGDTIVTASEDQDARVYTRDSRTGEWDSVTLQGHTEALSDVAINDDATLVATASEDKSARAWSKNDQGVWTPYLLEGHNGPVTRVVFSPDGTAIVTASTDGSARVWIRDERDGDGEWESEALVGHRGPLTWVAFSPDGARIATASEDKTARVWNVSSKGQWQSIILEGHTDIVNSLSFDADAQHLATASNDQTIRVWRIGRAAWEPVLWRATPLCLSSAERTLLLGQGLVQASEQANECARCVNHYRNPAAEPPCPHWLPRAARTATE